MGTPLTGATIRKLFGENVRSQRRKTGISQDELAARAGLHRTYISSIERGNRNVSLENIYAIAEALACDPRDLLAPLESAEGGR